MLSWNHRPCQGCSNTFSGVAPSVPLRAVRTLGDFIFASDFDLDNTGLYDPRLPTSTSTVCSLPSSIPGPINIRTQTRPRKRPSEAYFFPLPTGHGILGRSPWILRNEISGQNNQVSRAAAFRPASRWILVRVLCLPILHCGLPWRILLALFLRLLRFQRLGNRRGRPPWVIPERVQAAGAARARHLTMPDSDTKDRITTERFLIQGGCVTVHQKRATVRVPVASRFVFFFGLVPVLHGSAFGAWYQSAVVRLWEYSDE